MRKRLVYRADDMGYTEAFDLGAIRAFEEGIASSADVMFDSPHTVGILEWLKDKPWISIGWHRHFWETPVLGNEVPSMINEEGRFKWGHRKHELMKEATYEDCYKEFMAEAMLCKMITGRYPEAASYEFGDDLIPLEKAFRDVVIELNIPANFWYDSPRMPGDRKFDYLHYRQWNGENFGKNKDEFAIHTWPQYDPEGMIKQVKWENDDQIWRVGGHPGYCDDHILKESTCHIHRIKDLEANIALKQWIIDEEIELVNQNDVYFGTNVFQDHLKEINSPLWIGNIKKQKNEK